jgi:hypothetical protein
MYTDIVRQAGAGRGRERREKMTSTGYDNNQGMSSHHGLWTDSWERMTSSSLDPFSLYSHSLL